MSQRGDFADISLSKPSIFEIVAHESVAAVFRPAFHYLVKIIVRKYPEKLGILLKYADEIYMFCDLVLQRHYLSYYNASLSENFYYLKRLDVSVAGGRTLNTTLLNLSLFALVFLPYVKGKVDKIFENVRDKAVRQVNDNSQQGKFLKAFLKIYPYVHFALESPFAFYKFAYILNLVNYHSPVFHALKVQLVTANSEDLLGIPSNTYGRSLFQKVVSLPNFLMDKIVKFIATIMPAVIFSFQFIEWWYSTDHEMTSAVNKLPIPPPPQQPKVSDQGCGLPPHPLQCPLCQKVHSNMAALVSSGFVFCYPCIHHYVVQHGLCPVTQVPSRLDQISRIYSLKAG